MALEQEKVLDHQRTVDKLLDPLYFDRLLAMAEATCLRESPEVKSETLHGEQHVIAKVGLTGLRAAMDFLVGGEKVRHRQDVVEGMERRTVNTDSPIRHPRAFGDGLDYDRAQRVEAFGSQLMREACHVLGEDAREQLVAFREAKTEKEQVDVIDWLDERLLKITGVDPEGNQDLMYHPIRLSPKLIGEFPDISIPPTCLGVSIIAASFFREAGADVMHAGVVTSSQQQLLLEIGVMFRDFAEYCERDLGLEVPDQLSQRMQEKAREFFDAHRQETDYHAAVMVKLLSGRWAQVDSNFVATTRVPEDRTALMDAAFQQLSDLHEIAPGAESFLNISTNNVAHYVDYLNDHSERPAPPRDAIRTLLLDENTESFVERLRWEAVVPYFASETEDKVIQAIRYQLGTIGHKAYGVYKEQILTTAYHEVFESWFLDKEDLMDVLKRCRRDERYLERKIEDALILAPLTLSMFTLMAYNSRIEFPSDGGYTHPIVEAGLPETRIGNAVLHEFAKFTDDPLSAHHWLSQWPSMIPILEQADRADNSPALEALFTNAINVAYDKTFTYPSGYGKTVEFLKVRRESDVDQRGATDGTRQEEDQRG